jgi:cytosine/adenosine deaminase-related metal-dependent hydrolase
MGLNEAQAWYTAALAEIATYDEPSIQTRPGDPHLVLFREVIGLDPSKIDDTVAMARRFLEDGRQKANRFPRRGLSPHAPYSVHPRLLERLIDLAKEFEAPVTMHLAESKGEVELLRSGTGEFVAFLKGLGVWRPEIFEQPRRPLDILRLLDGLPRVIIAHGNYLDDEELAFIAERPNFSIAFCPRTHLYFCHADHLWEKLLALGGRVVLGTDGRSSNPDLSLWNEVVFLRRRFPNHDPADFLRMATLEGACALGLDSTLGTIEPGKEARMALVLLGISRSQDPYAQLFDPRSHLAGDVGPAALTTRLQFPRIFR